MSVFKGMLSFVTVVAIGSALWQFLDTPNGRELTTKLSEYFKNKLDESTAASAGNPEQPEKEEGNDAPLE